MEYPSFYYLYYSNTTITLLLYYFYYQRNIAPPHNKFQMTLLTSVTASLRCSHVHHSPPTASPTLTNPLCCSENGGGMSTLTFFPRSSFFFP